MVDADPCLRTSIYPEGRKPLELTVKKGGRLRPMRHTA